MVHNKVIQHRRIFGLDLVRAIAILLVVISHTSGIFKLNANLLPPPKNPNTSYFMETAQELEEKAKQEQATEKAAHPKRNPGRVWMAGMAGVELFFVLSGFLIGTILIRKFVSAPAYALKDVRQFLVRRWLRTIPVYWVVLTVIILARHFIEHKEMLWHISSFYVFLENFTSAPPRFFAVAWSLAVEEWFYLSVPFVIYAASRIFPRTDKYKLLLYTFCSYILFFVLLRVANTLYLPYGNNFDSGIRKVVIFRLDAIMYGVVVALFMQQQQSFLLRNKYPLLVISVLSTVGLLLLMNYFSPGFTDESQLMYLPFNAVLIYTLFPMAMSLCLPFAASYVTDNGKKSLVVGGITYVSKISYSVYLTHYFLYYTVGFSDYHFDNYLYAALFYLLYLAVLTGISSLLYRYVEQTALKYRDRHFPAQA